MNWKIKPCRQINGVWPALRPRHLIFFFLFAVLPPGAAKGEDGASLLGILGQRITRAWESDKYDLYLPVNTWHNRFMYDQDYRKEREYNEQPWGLGIGRYFLDEDLDSHGLYVMGFADSNYQFQYIGGYVFVKNWSFDEKKEWSAGPGYTLSLTGRHEYYYVPLPLPLPVVSVRYKKLAVQAAYVPGSRNDANVLFTWLRWNLD
jgi:palmitoyl transferase